MTKWYATVLILFSVSGASVATLTASMVPGQGYALSLLPYVTGVAAAILTLFTLQHRFRLQNHLWDKPQQKFLWDSQWRIYGSAITLWLAIQLWYSLFERVGQGDDLVVLFFLYSGVGLTFFQVAGGVWLLSRGSFMEGVAWHEARHHTAQYITIYALAALAAGFLTRYLLFS